MSYLEGIREAELAEFGRMHPDDENRALAADIFLRTQLTNGEITACVLHPTSGVPLQLGNDGWKPVPAYLLPGAMIDYIDPEEMFFGPPGTGILGQRRRVFFMHDEFKDWFYRNFPTVAKLGRPINSGSFREADKPLVVEIKGMLASDPLLSIPMAVAKVAARAVGGGTLESRAKRLERRIAEEFRSLRSF